MNFRAARQNMVDSQVRPNGITDRRIIDALLDVPREAFVPEASRMFAYMDRAVQLSASRQLMDSRTFARMLQLAEVRPEDKLLVVAAGSGFGAAVASRIGAHVVAIEQDTDLVRAARVNLDGLLNVTVVEGEHLAGHSFAAPYNVIIVEGGIGVVPVQLVDQLAEGGRFVAAFGDGLFCMLRVGIKRHGVLTWRTGDDCNVGGAPGFEVKAPEFEF
jgi:protein-L-isoaspartate(D-aspartate) O-methyltransferase